jgi:hypothetical protein
MPVTGLRQTGHGFPHKALPRRRTCVRTARTRPRAACPCTARNHARDAPHTTFCTAGGHASRTRELLRNAQLRLSRLPFRPRATAVTHAGSSVKYCAYERTCTRTSACAVATRAAATAARIIAASRTAAAPRESLGSGPADTREDRGGSRRTARCTPARRCGCIVGTPE